MSQYEQQDNEGELFNNKQRTEENNRPHYTGKCRVDGVDKQMSAYINVAGENAKNPGEKYLKIRFQEPWVSRKTENTEKPIEEVSPNTKPIKDFSPVLPIAIINIPAVAIMIDIQTFSEIRSLRNKNAKRAVKKGIAAKQSKVTAALVFVIE